MYRHAVPLLLLALAQCAAYQTTLTDVRRTTGTHRHARPVAMARPREYSKTARVVERAKTTPELKKKQNTVGAIVGIAYFSQFGIIGFAALAKLGLVKAPPLNTFTAIANAAMDQAVATGEVQPLMATAWAQGFWADLFTQYYSSGQPDDFVAKWCAVTEHVGWCSASGL